ncbi:hypothetical protein FAZ78_15470 [Cereibacter changlensis]|uniref:Uncharacterized protein n=1 Tax=Cereibacter changlensis TaxID=402884 RepID=A0A4U0YYD6_9RHOB|nr:hypothetical protein [Cereibacter changlensis]TKA95706.1 hypothetical protein FAZ78_15470 [Cereibacter changlensis]
MARVRVHWMHNALAHISGGRHTLVAEAMVEAFAPIDAEENGLISSISTRAAGSCRQTVR